MPIKYLTDVIKKLLVATAFRLYMRGWKSSALEKKYLN